MTITITLKMTLKEGSSFDFGKLIPRPAEEEKIGTTGTAIIGVLNGMPAMSMSTITKRNLTLSV